MIYLWVGGKLLGGGGDYLEYTRQGTVYAAEVIENGPTALLAPERWSPERWWGAGVVSRIAGVFVLAVGPSIVPVSLMFSLLGYAGVLLFVLAFQRSIPAASTSPYAAWLILAPSLTFWPATTGKEALILLGLGLATLGLTRPARPVYALCMIAGTGLIFAIRPQLTVVWVASAVITQAVVLGLHRSRRNGVKMAWTVLGAVLVVELASRAIAVADMPWTGSEFSFYRPGDVMTFLKQKAAASFQGESALSDSQTSFPLLDATVDTWLRPLLWNVRSPFQAFAAAEVILFWAIAMARRRSILDFARTHGREPLVIFSLVFTVIYAVALGLAISNEGALVRQRTLMLPFLFVLVSGSGNRQPDPTGSHG